MDRWETCRRDLACCLFSPFLHLASDVSFWVVPCACVCACEMRCEMRREISGERTRFRGNPGRRRVRWKEGACDEDIGRAFRKGEAGR